ncbi:phosphoribosyltransferase [Hoyosella rhizosphaerae]|uniref:Phosphoribosyltransferase domain-containing protein n=1 Tax=Hoyosella rhizosphaerae TaxID=1755582 RepID=A0A916UG55_9ACTN|nr:phosphoribosyltransferase family protein [Hoyosella rhizosphaerae]MBN4927866.1 phosphoribosyltransferase [Hoyosella rhizosphaerae]GGC70578.1 hypothetical protein GCM10011410_24290 [Hoyosella rhizosphaerae]
MAYKNREHAGEVLARELERFITETTTVLGLPRGGVPIAAVIANAWSVPLDILVVRKLGVPSHPELAFGAIGEDNTQVLNADVVAAERLTRRDIAQVHDAEAQELQRRCGLFRRNMPRANIAGRDVVIADDGIATGATMEAACRVARARGASRIVVAVPVAASQAITRLENVTDTIVCPLVTHNLGAVGRWYETFDQVSEREVSSLLTDEGRSK